MIHFCFLHAYRTGEHLVSKGFLTEKSEPSLEWAFQQTANNRFVWLAAYLQAGRGRKERILYRKFPHPGLCASRLRSN
jgi:hypothetical protein